MTQFLCPSEFHLPMTPFTFACGKVPGHAGVHESRWEEAEDGQSFYVARPTEIGNHSHAQEGAP